MNEKKIIIPDGMMQAAKEAQGISSYPTKQVVEAALRWLSENPISPTLEQAEVMYDGIKGAHSYTIQQCMIEWQRRMFLASEPKIPEEIKNLLANTTNEDLHISQVKHHEWLNKQILEAYRRGKESCLNGK